MTVDTAAEYVAAQKAAGVDYIKLMQEDCCSFAMPTGAIPSATPDLQKAICDAAHAEGLLAVSHALSLDNTRIVLEAGTDGLTHTFIDQPPTEEIIELYKSTNAFVVPTFVILASMTGELQDWRDKFADIATERKLLPNQAMLDNMRLAFNMKSPDARMEYALQTITRLHAEGVDVVAGTDAVAGLQGSGLGPSLWMEMLLYVERCGFTTEQALASATGLSSRRFGFSDRGVIESGRRADLVLVKGDVIRSGLQTLWEGEGVVKVWKEGIPSVATA